MRRFAIFAAVLLVVVVAGSQPWKANSSKASWCVCLPSRAGLLLKSMTNTATNTKTAAPSKQSAASRAAVTSPSNTAL
jgi:hypothetical protein